MKKKLLMIVAVFMLLVPSIVFADGASYSFVTYEAIVNVKDGLTLVPYDYEEEEGNCFGEDDCNNAYEADEIAESSEDEDDEDSDMEMIKLKYGTKINVLYEDEDGDPCFKYNDRYFCTDSYNLIGTKVDLKDFKDDKLQKPRQVVAFTDIALYEGPSYVFNEAKAKIKPGDDAKVTYYTENLWFYVEGPGYTGWIFEDDFMTTDEENEDEDYYYTYKGYVKDDYEFIVYGNDALVFDKNSQLLKEKIPSGTVIKSIGAIYGGFTSYVYYNNQNELRIVLMDEDETGYKMDDLRLYINNNKDVKMYEVNKYNTPVDSSKILKNKTFYEVAEYTFSDDIEYYLLKINNSRYVVEISRSYILNRMIMPDQNYGAVAVNNELLTSKISFGLLITANDTPSYESPDSKSGARETIKKNTGILPLAFQYNSKTKEFYLLAYNYGWILVDENSFVANPDAEKEEYEECIEDNACGEGFWYDLNPYELDVYYEIDSNFYDVYQIEYIMENEDDEDAEAVENSVPDKTWKKLMAVFGNKNRHDYEESTTPEIKKIMEDYKIKPYESEDYVDEDDEDDDDWVEEEYDDSGSEIGDASLKEVRDAKKSKQKANEKNRPTQAIAREQKNKKFELIIPLLTSFAIAVLVSAVIVILLLAAHKKKKLAATQALTPVNPEDTPASEPQPEEASAQAEEEKVEEPTPETPAEETPAEEPKEEVTEEVKEEETPEEPPKEEPASEPQPEEVKDEEK